MTERRVRTQYISAKQRWEDPELREKMLKAHKLATDKMMKQRLYDLANSSKKEAEEQE